MATRNDLVAIKSKQIVERPLVADSIAGAIGNGNANGGGGAVAAVATSGNGKQLAAHPFGWLVCLASEVKLSEVK